MIEIAPLRSNIACLIWSSRSTPSSSRPFSRMSSSRIFILAIRSSCTTPFSIRISGASSKTWLMSAQRWATRSLARLMTTSVIVMIAAVVSDESFPISA